MEKISGLISYVKGKVKACLRRNHTSRPIEVKKTARENDSEFLPGYFWPDVSREQSEHLLEDKPIGTFLVRRVSHPRHSFAVTYKRDEKTASMLIEYDKDSKSYGLDLTNPNLPKRSSMPELINELIFQSKDHSLVLKRDFNVERVAKLKLKFPLYRVLSLKEQCRLSLVKSLKVYVDFREFDLPLELVEYMKEKLV